MVLLDTSLWIEFLRIGGDANAQDRVEQHLLGGTAAVAAPILIELWNGIRGEKERRAVARIQNSVPILGCPDQVFALAYAQADRSRKAGLTIAALDILIFAIGRHHGVRVESLDSHFDLMAKKLC